MTETTSFRISPRRNSEGHVIFVLVIEWFTNGKFVRDKQYALLPEAFDNFVQSCLEAPKTVENWK